MITRFYVHNFRCLENFELNLKGMSSVLLIGNNGAGKSTIATAMEILQQIGRGINRVGKLVQAKDFSRGDSSVPMRFELEIILGGIVYEYTLAFELPENFKELRVYEEKLVIAGHPVYSRKQAQVIFHPTPESNDAQFLVDWHLVALSLIQEPSGRSSLGTFRNWLAQTIILAPIPSLMHGESSEETLEPTRDAANFGNWLSGVLASFPAAYLVIEIFLKQPQFLPDFLDIQNPILGGNTKTLRVGFEKSGKKMNLSFSDLSDGEKCFFLCALVVAANKFYGPLFCFWDEPDSHLALSEVGHFILALRRSFKHGGQLVITSHDAEAIQKFSNENTWLIYRRSHLEPACLKPLSDITIHGDIVDALIRGDVEP